MGTGLCSWIVLGFLAGVLARAIMPGRQPMGWVATTLLGIAGSFMGGFLASVLWGGGWRVVSTSSFIGSVVGAIVLLAISGLIRKA